MTTPYTPTPFHDISNDDNPQSPPGVSQPSKSNTLANKITSVLSASYADTEIRNALALLDARGTTNTAETRRSLRLDAQKEIIDCNVAILNEFGHVAEQLHHINDLLATLNTTVASMRASILASRSDAAPLLDEASTLITAKAESTTKQSVLSAFTSHFLPLDADLDVLTSSAIPVDDRYFTVLSRVQRIHRDCEVLLGGEDERLGLELMESTSRNLDAGFKKLHGWVARSLRGLDFEDPRIDSIVRRALRVLGQRPALFTHALDILAEAREVALAEGFERALEGGETGGSAIEFFAADVLRYMGDMLAWVHATTVSEKEALEGLFVADPGEDSTSRTLHSSEPWLQDFPSTAGRKPSNSDDEEIETPFDPGSALNLLISRALNTVSATLQSRIQPALHTPQDSVLLFKAQTLLSFYHSLFSKLLGPTSTIASAVSRLEAAAMERMDGLLATSAEGEEGGDSETEAWFHDPIEGPARHEGNLGTLEALFKVKAPGEMGLAQLENFCKHFVGGARKFAEDIAARYTSSEGDNDSHDADEDKLNKEQQLILAVFYTRRTAASLSKYTTIDPDADAILHPPTTQTLQASLAESLTVHLATTMRSLSGLAALQREPIDKDNDGEDDQGEEEEEESVLSKLPDYASRLDAFLSDGYAALVARLKLLDQHQHLQQQARGNGRDKEHGGGDEEDRDVVTEARERFLAELGEVMRRLDERDERIGQQEAGEGGAVRFRERYPRTMEDVRILLE